MLPSDKPNIIYMSNHISMEDVVALHNKLPASVHFVIFNEQEYKINEPKLKNRAVTVHEQLNANTIVQTLKLVETGQPVLLFPELKISKAGNLLRIYPEIAYIAYKSNAVIHPIILHKYEKSSSYPNPLKLVETFVSPNKSYSINFGKPFDLSQFENVKGENEKEKLSSFIYTKLNALKFETNSKQNVNLYNELLLSAKNFKGDGYIIKDMSGSLDYNKLILSINVMTQKLEKEVTDNRVGVLLPNSIGHVVALYSLFKKGITPAILNFTMGQQNLIDCCEAAELKTIITSKEFIEKGNLQELIEPLASRYKIIYLENVKKSINHVDKIFGLANNYLHQKSTAATNEIILFTSGSESKPKGVVLTHDNIYANLQQAISSLDVTHEDKFFNALPLFHSFGLSAGTILPLVIGIPLFLYPSPTHSKEIPKLIYNDDISIVITTPTFLGHYEHYAHPSTFNNVRYVIAGGERLKPETKMSWMNKFGIRILEGYGATEAAPVLSLNTPLYSKAGSVGKILPGIEYMLKPVEGIEKGGCLLVKGPNLMKGYLIHGKGFIKQEGWYDTGDVVEVDEHGFITIQSRLKRFAKIGGEMVSLNLIEELAAECFGHTGFAAVAIPDKRKGERIVLFTDKAEQESFLHTMERTFKKYIKGKKISGLVIPSNIEEISEIPLLGSGKTDYVTLQQNALEIK